MANKLVQQQLKNVLRGLNDLDIEKLLTNYEILSNTKFSKTCHMVSYKCYEATMIHKTWTANGYGRTEIEASANCIKNFLEMIMEEENCLSTLIRALKKGSDAASHHHGQDRNHYDKQQQSVNNTIALNVSYAHQAESNVSFENKKDIEILSKNIGNISVIGNHRQPIEANPNASQLEDDMLLNMLEDGVNPGATNHFRKSLPPQHPNGLDLTASQSLAAKTLAMHKNERTSQIVGRGSVGTAESEGTKSQKVLQENNNVHNGGRFSLDAHARKEEREENRHEYRQAEPEVPSHYQKQRNSYSNSNKNLEPKHLHYSHSSSNGNFGPGSGHETSGHTGGGKCSCSCAEQLQRANLRIESLEKKLKMLNDENKILKYLTENKEKDVKSGSSTMNSTSGASKGLYEKSVGNNYDLTPHENYDDTNEFPERDSSNRNDNKRSVSVDTFAKRKTLVEQNKIPSFNKENNMNDSMDKKDPKKLIPRLKLEMIPNYHAKFSHTSSQNPPVEVNKNPIQNPPGSHVFNQNSFELLAGNGMSSSLSKYLKK